MSIPKNIFQTFKSNELPTLTRWHIYKLKKRNPDYTYHFYDDAKIESFMREEFDDRVYNAYQKLNIGAAKADFFRYAVLYKKGGVYLDIDSLILKPIHQIIKNSDEAVISMATHKQNYVQWALFSAPNHPFLGKTIEYMVDNIEQNRYPYDVHKMTGPTVYSQAIESCLKEDNQVNYRELGLDYDGKLKFSYRFSKFFLYGLSRKDHWKKLAKERPVLK